MRFQVSCRPSSFGSTKYRNASAEPTNSSVPRSRPRVNRTRGSSSAVAVRRVRRPAARASAASRDERRSAHGTLPSRRASSGLQDRRHAPVDRGQARRPRPDPLGQRRARRSGRPRSARPGRRAPGRASARRSSRRRRRPGRPRRAGARPSATWRSAATAWQQADFLREHRKGRSQRSPQNSLAVLDHHPPHARAAAPSSQAPSGGRPPRRRGRDRPVEDRAEVEHRVHPRRRGREPLRRAQQHVGDAARAGRRTTSSGTRPAPARTG